MDPYPQNGKLLHVGGSRLLWPNRDELAYSLRFSSGLVAFLLFALTNLMLSVLSTPDSSTAAYLGAAFFSGLSVGAVMNYTLSHLLHLTSPDMHYVISALLGMSRGFAGSFGSSIGGGFFQRELKRGLETGFTKHGLSGREELIRKLLGSPALAKSLTGVERAVAVQSYEQAVKMLLLGACMLTLAGAAAQAGTGWVPYKKATQGQDFDDLESTPERAR